MEATLYHISVPIKNHFKHVSANHTSAENIVLSVNYLGYKLFGECVPRKFISGESPESVFTVLKTIDLSALLGKINLKNEAAAVKCLLGINWSNFFDADKNPNVLCLLDLICFDLISSHFKKPLHRIVSQYFTHSSYDLSNLKSSQTFDYSLSLTDFLKRAPFHHIKVKVGRSLIDDLDRVKEIRESVGDNVSISIDANMAWNLKQAIKIIKLFSKFNIDWVEEPLIQGSTLENYRDLKLSVTCPIMLDESFYLLDHLTKALCFNACDIVNIRLSKCGGLLNSIKMINFARDNGIKYQIGAQVAESGPLIAAANHLSGCLSDKLAYEAGQVDRFFEDELFSPRPLVNRCTNYAELVKNDGIGLQLGDGFKKYVSKKISFRNKKWK